jgi:hypothetical protein
VVARVRVDRYDMRPASSLEFRLEAYDDTNSWNGPLALHAKEDLYDLLDDRVAVGVSTSHRATAGQSETGAADDLIGSLYANYCEALQSSDAIAAGAWGRPLDVVAEATPPSAPDFDDVEAMGNSITELISEPMTLEEAIGPLVPDPAFETADLSLASAPEILQLFAPPEYAAGTAARKEIVPPALVRREHHTLAIDSVFPVSDVRVSQPVGE